MSDSMADCPACVPCAEHLEYPDGRVSDNHHDEGEHECTANSADPCDNCRELDRQAEHDVAECGCPVYAPCEACVAACEADDHKKLQAELKVLKAGILAMISRNGFCVVCERYAPMHMVFCPMG